MTTPFRTRLRNKEQLIGTMISLPGPEIAELMSLLGFDWLFLDAEHGPFDMQVCQQMLQAVGGRADCLIRVPVGSHTAIKKALDIGATGVIVPQVNSAEAAKSVVAACKYPPEGTRGVGLSRAHGYGVTFGEYIEQANAEITVVIQAEHIEAVENIEAITAVSGIDAVLIGPYDLSASMGKIGQVTDPEVLAAIERIRQACLNANVALGFFGLTAESLKPYADLGYTLLCCGTETSILSSGGAEILETLRS